MPPPLPPPRRKGRGEPPLPLLPPPPPPPPLSPPPAAARSAGEESEAEKKAVVAGGGSSAVLALEPLHSSVRGFFFFFFNVACSDVGNVRVKARKLLPSPPPFLNFCSPEGAGPVPGPLRRPWWVGLMAVRGLLRLLGPVQPEPGATLLSVASAPAASSDGIEWYRSLYRPLFLAASSAVLGGSAKDPAAFLPTLETV